METNEYYKNMANYYRDMRDYFGGFNKSYELCIEEACRYERLYINILDEWLEAYKIEYNNKG